MWWVVVRGPLQISRLCVPLEVHCAGIYDGCGGAVPSGYADRVHSTASSSAIARKCHGLMGRPHQTAHCRELSACNRTETEKPVPQLQAGRGVTVKETSTGPLRSSRSPDNPLVNNSINEITLESPLDFKEIQPVHPKGNQS